MQYPGAVIDPDTGDLDLRCRGRRTPTLHRRIQPSTRHPATARLIVRRVREPGPARRVVPGLAPPPVPHQQRSSRPLPPTSPTADTPPSANRVRRPDRRTPRTHAIRPIPAANGARAICAALTHNLLRAAGTLTSPVHAVARGATLRRDIIAVPARLAAHNAGASPTPARALAMRPSVKRPLWTRGYSTTTSHHHELPDPSTRRTAPAGDPSGKLGRPANQSCRNQTQPASTRSPAAASPSAEKECTVRRGADRRGNSATWSPWTWRFTGPFTILTAIEAIGGRGKSTPDG